jgi:hypothetical protein
MTEVEEETVGVTVEVETEEDVEDLITREALLVLDAETITVRCTKQLVETVENLVKFHFALQEKSLYFVETVLVQRKTRATNTDHVTKEEVTQEATTMT